MTREEAIDFAEFLKNNWIINFAEMEEFGDMAIEALQAEPVKHGKWVHEGVDYMTEQECWSRLPCFCSECKQETRAYFHNYCPNCGAKMDKK